MLTVLRNVFIEELLMAETARGCGSADVGAGVVGGRNAEEEEGARRPLFGLGVDGLDFDAGVGRFPVLFLVFGTGRAGRAMVGGPFEGLAGLGSVVAIPYRKREWELVVLQNNNRPEVGRDAF